MVKHSIELISDYFAMLLYRDISETLHLNHAVGLLQDSAPYTLFIVNVGWKP